MLTKYEHLTGQFHLWLENLQIAGMAGVVKTHTKTTSKVLARGKTCLFACYATDHTKNCFVMMDPQTKSIAHSREMTFGSTVCISNPGGLQEPKLW